MSESDHRRLGRELDLFHFQEEAPGAVFWHPRGLELVRALEAHLRRIVLRDGYREVRTPQVLARSVWQASGHWDSFRAGMMPLARDDEREAALKPVSCPGHVQIALDAQPSHRDLPLRYAELGVVHRKEPSGVLHGLFRLRQFTQDDGHVLCAPAQVHDELVRVLARMQHLYAGFGFPELDVALATRPDVRAGDDALWDRAEHELAEAARAAGFSPRNKPGEGAFYGPKIELGLRDRAGRAWQCGTVQLDYVMPARFGASYVAADGRRAPLVMIHRALLGSVERFCGVLLEHHDGKLPGWLAPEAVRVLAVSGKQAAYAASLADDLRARGVRAEADRKEAPLGGRIREAHAARVPFVLVVGAREEAASSVVLRGEGGATDEVLAREEGLARLASACAPPAP